MKDLFVIYLKQSLIILVVSLFYITVMIRAVEDSMKELGISGFFFKNRLLKIAIKEAIYSFIPLYNYFRFFYYLNVLSLKHEARVEVLTSHWRSEA